MIDPKNTRGCRITNTSRLIIRSTQDLGTLLEKFNGVKIEISLIYEP